MKKALGPVTLAYPMPAFLVAAYDEKGKANIMTAAWGGICCSNPPCVAVSVRPERWTHKAIVARKAFTVCVPSAAQAAMVDFAGMVSGAREDNIFRLTSTISRSKGTPIASASAAISRIIVLKASRCLPSLWKSAAVA